MEKEQAKITENIMGTMPVNKLLLRMSIPMMVSMLVQALYNIVDSMFVAQINENALTAVSLAFPMQNLMISVGTGIGVGVNALLSKALGEKDMKTVNKTASNSVFLAICSYVVFLVVGVFGSRAFFLAQTNIEEIVNYGTVYMTICTAFSFGLFGQFAFERMLQSTGKTFYTMLTQGIGAIINIILDPILIFGRMGFPAFGIAGAAIATVIGQLIAASLAIWFCIRKNHEVKLSIVEMKPEKRIIEQIFFVGIPSIILSSIGSVTTFGLNKILIVFSSTATAAFGVYFKLQSFIFLPVFGLNNGLVPIVAYNYGARRPKRITKAVKLSVCYATVMMVIGIAIFQIFPKELLQIFNASDYMLEIGTTMLRIISVHFIFAGLSIVSTTLFQALSHGMLSLTVSVVRQLVVLLPVAYLLAQTGRLEMVWWAYPFAEIFSVLICSCGDYYVYKKDIKTL